jgi:hypothetical protein
MISQGLQNRGTHEITPKTIENSSLVVWGPNMSIYGVLSGEANHNFEVATDWQVLG